MKTKKTPTKAQIIKWTNALRSGNFKQTKGSLQYGNKYCCLGVACELFIPGNLQKRANKITGSFGTGPRFNGELYGETPNNQNNAPEWLVRIDNDFFKKTGVRLSALNDGELWAVPGISDTRDARLSSFTFNEIADLLDAVYIYKVLK